MYLTDNQRNTPPENRGGVSIYPYGAIEHIFSAKFQYKYTIFSG